VDDGAVAGVAIAGLILASTAAVDTMVRGSTTKSIGTLVVGVVAVVAAVVLLRRSAPNPPPQPAAPPADEAPDPPMPASP